MKSSAAAALWRLAPMSTCAAVIATVLTACGGSGSGGGVVFPSAAPAPAPVPAPAPAPVAKDTRTTVALLETTDLHFNVLSFDYFKLAEDKSYATSVPPR